MTGYATLREPRYGGSLARRNPYFAPPAISYVPMEGRRREMPVAQNPYFAPPAIQYVSGGVPRDWELAGLGQLPAPRPFLPGPSGSMAAELIPLATPFHNDGLGVGDEVGVPRRDGGYEEGRILDIRGSSAIVLIERPLGIYRKRVPVAFLMPLDSLFEEETFVMSNPGYDRYGHSASWSMTHAQRHARQAADMIARGELPEARVALQEAMQDVQSAEFMAYPTELKNPYHPHHGPHHQVHRAFSEGPGPETLEDLYDRGFPNPKKKRTTKKKWVKGVKTKWKPPEGLFAYGSGKQIADEILKAHDNELAGSMSSLMFYVNRNKAKLKKNKERWRALMAAKKAIQARGKKKRGKVTKVPKHKTTRRRAAANPKKKRRR